MTTAKRVKDAKIEKKFETARNAKAKTPKFSSRRHNRCKICGRPRAFLRKFGLCRLCFRGLALRGEFPAWRSLRGSERRSSLAMSLAGTMRRMVD